MLNTSLVKYRLLKISDAKQIVQPKMVMKFPALVNYNFTRLVFSISNRADSQLEYSMGYHNILIPCQIQNC